jgi:hypothetical protein
MGQFNLQETCMLKMSITNMGVAQFPGQRDSATWAQCWTTLFSTLLRRRRHNP